MAAITMTLPRGTSMTFIVLGIVTLSYAMNMTGSMNMNMANHNMNSSMNMNMTNHNMNSSMNMTGHNMSGHNMTGHYMSGHNMTGHNMSGHNMTGHNMSGHDMTNHDMSGHDMTGGHATSFHVGFEEIILFREWVTSNEWNFALTCIFFFILSVLYEGLKSFREYLNHRYAGSVGEKYTCQNGGGGYDTNIKKPKGGCGAHMCRCVHYLQAFLHILQVFVSYVLMMVFMLLNVWLCVAVCVGAGVGYLLFGWRRSVVNDENEHCN
ncbi:high affinity copper uptake protein 1 isoform X2 [Lingula anatina]|uniref:Copper transport protein n=1 Tax=Lingula anatina TaxID=7574 RepID=A0A1S3HTT6_LINAN|nr:high affinity copper uptake protein 1 isoform X2 [Lingula anatina]|eukprot:XP_013389452.1 high affinity copper uptake protein 1 isoform X2 [Lingula anatina]